MFHYVTHSFYVIHCLIAPAVERPLCNARVFSQCRDLPLPGKDPAHDRFPAFH